jgi:hypothetical protein
LVLDAVVVAQKVVCEDSAGMQCCEVEVRELGTQFSFDVVDSSMRHLPQLPDQSGRVGGGAGEAFGTEDEQSDHGNDEDFRETEVAEHGATF